MARTRAVGAWHQAAEAYPEDGNASSAICVRLELKSHLKHAEARKAVMRM